MSAIAAQSKIMPPRSWLTDRELALQAGSKTLGEYSEAEWTADLWPLLSPRSQRMVSSRVTAYCCPRVVDALLAKRYERVSTHPISSETPGTIYPYVPEPLFAVEMASIIPSGIFTVSPPARMTTGCLGKASLAHIMPDMHLVYKRPRLVTPWNSPDTVESLELGEQVPVPISCYVCDLSKLLGCLRKASDLAVKLILDQTTPRLEGRERMRAI